MFTANCSWLRVERESLCSEKSASSLLGVNWVYGFSQREREAEVVRESSAARPLNSSNYGELNMPPNTVRTYPSMGKAPAERQPAEGQDMTYRFPNILCSPPTPTLHTATNGLHSGRNGQSSFPLSTSCKLLHLYAH
jgi:hypothetical protein